MVVFTSCGTSDPVVVQHVDPILRAGLHIRYPTVDGFRRSYAIYLPESVPLNGPPAPVVMVLHGYPPVDMSVVTAMNEAAEEHAFIAVYPKANRQGEWTMACDQCSPNAVQGVDDTAYLGAIMDALPEMLPVDTRRYYLTGFSNGGIMTFRAACEMSDRIAAFAPIGAGMWTWHRDNCAPGRAVPIAMIQGTDDPSFPWDGVVVSAPLAGNDFQIPVPETVALWQSQNGCSGVEPEPTSVDDVDDDTSVHRFSYSACSAETLFYRVDGGGHTWPGGPVDFNPALGRKSLELPATDSIVAFFLRQSR